MKLKKCQEQAILLYLRDALIQERCKSYYRKNTNIQDILEEYGMVGTPIHC